jgi:hypothetical protein
MSLYTYVDVVPFKIETDMHGEEDSLVMQTRFAKICMKSGFEESPFDFAGWVEEVVVMIIGKEQQIYVTPIRKEGKEVYLLNESQYESVGDYEISFISNKKEDLIAFCQDVGLDANKIKSDVAVKWTT